MPKFKPIERKRSRGQSSRTSNVNEIRGLDSSSQSSVLRTVTALPDGRSQKRARTSVLYVRERSPSPVTPPTSDRIPPDAEDVGGWVSDDVGADGNHIFDDDSSWRFDDAFDSDLGITQTFQDAQIGTKARSDGDMASEDESDIESTEGLDEDERENLAGVRTELFYSYPI
jgi:hypothetical protein